MPNSKNGRPMQDALSLLKADHQTVRKLLSQLEESTPRAVKKREELLQKLGDEIRIHARIEEEIFYPAFQDAGENHDDNKMFFEAAEEHGLVDIVLPALEESDPASDVFGAKGKVLKDLIEHHAEEEEQEMFPRAKKLLGQERLMELGEELAARKKELMSELGARS